MVPGEKMQPEDIIRLLESDDKTDRRLGVNAYFEFLILPSSEVEDSKDDSKDDSKENYQSSYKHTKLWKTIRTLVWNNNEADEIISTFFEYIMRRFTVSDKLSDEEIAEAKEAPKIQNLEAFAVWKCKKLILDYKRKMGKQRERELITDEPKERNDSGSYFQSRIDGELVFNNEEKSLDQDENKNLSFNEDDNEENIKNMRMLIDRFGKEVSADGAEAIIMQKFDGASIKKIADWQNRTTSAQKEFIRVSKERLAKYCIKHGNFKE